MIDEFLGTNAKVNVYGINLNLWFVLIVVVLIITGIVIWAISMFIRTDENSVPKKGKDHEEEI